MKSTIVLAAIIALAIVHWDVTSADNQQVSTSTMATTTTMASFYFGVDANDKEAVARRQKELGQEKWEEMMGNMDINQVAFVPQFFEFNPRDAGKKMIGEAEKTLSKAVEYLHDLLFKHLKLQEATTLPPGAPTTLSPEAPTTLPQQTQV